MIDPELLEQQRAENEAMLAATPVVAVDAEHHTAALAEAVADGCEEGRPPAELVDLFIELEAQGKVPEDLASFGEPQPDKHPAKGRGRKEASA